MLGKVGALGLGRSRQAAEGGGGPVAPSVAVFSDGAGGWEMRDGNTSIPDGYVATSDGGQTFDIDTAASSGLALLITDGDPEVEYVPPVAVFSDGAGGWEVRDGNTATPDGFVVTNDAGQTFYIDTAAASGFLLSITAGSPEVTYP